MKKYPPNRCNSSSNTGHESRKSLEVHSLLAIREAQERYDEVMGRFPI